MAKYERIVNGIRLAPEAEPWTESERLVDLLFERWQGQPPHFTDGKQVIARFWEYYSWTLEYPIDVNRKVVYKGEVLDVNEKRKRLVNEPDFCTYMGVPPTYIEEELAQARVLDAAGDPAGKDIVNAIAAVRSFMGAEMDTCAAAGLYDANYIKLLRGLREKSDVQLSGGGNGLNITVASTLAADNLKRLASFGRIHSKPDEDDKGI